MKFALAFLGDYAALYREKLAIPLGLAGIALGLFFAIRAAETPLHFISIWFATLAGTLILPILPIVCFLFFIAAPIWLIVQIVDLQDNNKKH
ncbi:hypothetical protein [Pseudovibrio denitrificans]|uniref:hypothetical protein n=1 Tax=Pseudovibrio denitrificans TaxID=258256 RepID=UPI0006D0C185|nr:hypothetical protein [Pseudovibrio denitrificans]